MRFRRPSAARLLDVVFFAGFLAYAIFGIDTRLVYHWQSPSFYSTSEFFFDFLRYPGGLADWLYLLAAQAYTSQIGGALLLTLEAVAITVLAERCCRAMPLLRFFPTVLLVYSLSLYYDRTPLAIALLLGFGAAVVFLNSEAKALWPAFLLLTAVYYAGGMAVVIFGAAAAATLAASGRFPGAVAVAATATALPIAAQSSRLLYIPISAAHWFDDRAAILSLLCLFAALTGFLTAKAAGRDWRWAPAIVLASLAGMAAMSYRMNDRDRRLAAVDYYTTHENWPEVLAASATLRPDDFNSLTRYEVNLALHEMGRLGDEMFRFPQSGSMLPALRSETFLPYMIRVTDLLLRLGRLNDAEHFGHEAMILGDSDPRVLRLLAEIEIAKGQTTAARKYLTILSSEAQSAQWARTRLDSAGDEAVRTLSGRAPRTDDFISVWQNPEKPGADIERLLVDQLEADPTNRMAFEFLMGHYLLNRNLPAARALMPRIVQMPGRRTPRHYQEAMAMYGDGAGERVAIEGFEIEPETLDRMAVFKRLMAQSPGRDAAMHAAWDHFRDSYFFYFVFGPGDYR